MGNDYANICKLKTFGLAKSEFEAAFQGSEFDGVTVEFNEKCLSGAITIAKKSVDSLAISSALQKINSLFGEYVYTDTDEPLNKLVVNYLKREGSMISVAESITGGLIASKICEVSGASQVLYEGLVTYNSGSKVRRLHVPAGLIELETAVSESVCGAMLDGVLQNKEITYAIATTGYASDMSDMNGLAFVGFASRDFRHIDQVKFKGKRNEIREQVANYALFKMYKMLTAKNLF